MEAKLTVCPIYNGSLMSLTVYEYTFVDLRQWQRARWLRTRATASRALREMLGDLKSYSPRPYRTPPPKT